jgi:hypothetical protein
VRNAVRVAWRADPDRGRWNAANTRECELLKTWHVDKERTSQREHRFPPTPVRVGSPVLFSSSRPLPPLDLPFLGALVSWWSIKMPRMLDHGEGARMGCPASFSPAGSGRASVIGRLPRHRGASSCVGAASVRNCAALRDPPGEAPSSATPCASGWSSGCRLESVFRGSVGTSVDIAESVPGALVLVVDSRTSDSSARG